MPRERIHCAPCPAPAAASPVVGPRHFVNRALDILLALVLLMPTLLVTAGVALWVWAADGINPWFSQVRLGRDEREFRILKLRTMDPATAESGTHETPEAAVTRSGAMLRRFKIDELPQVINVLVGQMSFVGPRPGLPSQTELAAERRARGVFAVRPGITGLGQVMGVDMSTPGKLAELDARYLADRSLSMDLGILWKTLTGRGFGDPIVLERGKPERLPRRDLP